MRRAQGQTLAMRATAAPLLRGPFPPSPRLHHDSQKASPRARVLASKREFLALPCLALLHTGASRLDEQTVTLLGGLGGMCPSQEVLPRVSPGRKLQVFARTPSTLVGRPLQPQQDNHNHPRRLRSLPYLYSPALFPCSHQLLSRSMIPPSACLDSPASRTGGLAPVVRAAESLSADQRSHGLPPGS
jgi:hypothetical protein